MRITFKGRVTIPADIREQAGLLPGTKVDFEFDGKTVCIVRAASDSGRRSVSRQAHGETKMSTEEILALMGRD